MEFERCMYCKYDLRGRPPNQGTVVCPECGRVQDRVIALTRAAFCRIELETFAIGLIPLAIEFLAMIAADGWTQIGVGFFVAPVLCLLACILSAVFRAKRLKRLGYKAPQVMVVWAIVFATLQIALAWTVLLLTVRT